MSGLAIHQGQSMKIGFVQTLSIWIGVIACWASLNPWITWVSSNFNIALMVIFVASRIPFIRKNFDYSTLVSVSSLILFGFIYCQFFIIGIKSSIFQLINTIIPLIALVLFNNDEKDLFLKRVICLFSSILCVSTLYYLLHFFIELPYFLYNSLNDSYAPFKNYIIFVIESYSDFGWFTRFQSIYTEPGHLSMVCAIFLYINGYSLKKWQNIVMTVALIWSFSLAGFLLYFIGLILFCICRSKNISKTLFKIIASFSLLVAIGVSYYSPTNNDMLSVMILSRLEFDESKGISGNNRNSFVFDNYYDNFVKSDKIFMGIGRTEMDRIFTGTGNSSYKNYIVNNGILGIIAILFLMSMLLYCHPSRMGFGLMLLLIASFIQRPYFIWAIECMPYITALSKYYLTKKSY